MQAISARSSVQRVAICRKAQGGRVAAVNVVCQSSPLRQAAQKVAAAVVALPALIVAHPAYALVDERMNGDGTGRPLGINDGVLGYVLLGVFSSVWILWYQSQKDLGSDEGASINDGKDL